MTLRRRLSRSNLIMFLIPLLIAIILLTLGAGISLYILETKYLPQIGLSLHELQIRLEQYETMLSNFEIFVLVYLGAVGMSVLLGIAFTNLYLIRSLFRHISEPLDTLVAGVERIQSGDLESPIDYKRNDEFKAACDAVDMMAARLKNSLDEEQRRQQMHKELIAGMSHDLKSPLTSIRTYTEALIDGIASTPETQRHYLETIRSNEAEMEAMVRRLFEFSQLDLPEYPLNTERLELRSEIEAAAGAFDPKKIEIDLSDLERSYVLADAVQLRRIAENIIGNSIKYAGKEKVALKISSSIDEEYIALSFEDNGIGVPEELRSKIFDTFFRADPARNRSLSGSGLGLAIVKRTVEQMGGSVRAEKSQMGGLAVIINLRRSKRNA